MKTKIIQTVVLTVLTGIMAGGCDVTVRPPAAEVTVGGEVDVTGAPPAPMVDVQPVSPGPDFIWIGGAWAWEGGRWQWQRGRWDRPPHAGAHWVAHHYEYRNGRHVFVRGGWR